MKTKFPIPQSVAVFIVLAAGSAPADTSLTWTGGAGRHDDGYWHFEEAGNWSGGTLSMGDTSKYHLTFPSVESADEVKILMPNGGGTLSDGGKNFRGNLTIGDDDASKLARYTFVSAVPRSYGTADEPDALYAYGANAEVRYVNFGSADSVAQFSGGDNKFVVNAGGSVAFENCTMRFGSWETIKESVDGRVTLSNTVAWAGEYTVNPGGRLVLEGGSSFTHKRSFKVDAGADLIVDDSTFSIIGTDGFWFWGTVTIKGPDARVYTPISWTNGKTGDAKCVFVVPEGGYNYIPYVNGSATEKIGNEVRFEISPESPIFQSDWNYNVPEESAAIIPLFGWNKGMDGNIVKTADPDLTGLGEVACKWYHSTAALTPEIAAAGVAPAGMTWSSGRDAGDNERYLGVYILGEPSGGTEPDEPTPSVLDAANVVSSIDQRTVTVSGALTSRGSGDTRVYVKVGDGEPELVATFDYRSRTLDWSWERKLSNFGDTLAGTVYIVNGPKDNPNQFTSEPVAFGPFTAVDNAVYAWKGGTGSWTDATKWTADKEDHAALPPAGAQVTIPSAAVVTIDNAAVSADALTLAMDAQLVFKGAAPSLTLGSLSGSGTVTFEIPQGGWSSPRLNGTGATALADVKLAVSRESPALLGSTEWTTSTLVNWAGGFGGVGLDQGEAEGKGRIAAMVKSGNVVTVKTRRAPDVVLAKIPAVENVTLVSVSVGGVPVSPLQDGSYRIPGGSDVTVRFQAAAGYGLDRPSVVFNVGFGATATYPEELLPRAIEGGAIVINEVMASNETGLTTANGVAGLDWIELRNDGDVAIDLAADGWKITDNPDKPKKAKPVQGKAILPAGGYLVIFADKYATNWNDSVEAHVAVGLSGGGERVALVSPGDVVITTFAFEQQFADVSVGPAAGDATGKTVYFTAPTPGRANPASGRTGLTPEVVFSEPHGWKTAPFDLELRCKDGVARDIHYTLDGTSPTLESAKYTGKIHVSQTTVVRAAVIDPDAIFQRDSAATYLYVDHLLDNSVDHRPAGFRDNWDQSGKYRGYKLRDDVVNSTDPEVQRRLHDGFTNSIRTVSIVMDPSDLFDWQTGIYVNAGWDGRESERMTMFEQINPLDPDDGFSVPCGIRIRGAASRDSRAKHGFHVLFRSEYGMSNLKFPLFGKDGSDTFDKIDLRCDQNQSYEQGNIESTFIHELFARDCERDFGKTYNRSQYLHLFINGSYFGMYQYEERCSSSYGEENLGGRAENWQVVRSDHLANKHNAYFVDGPGSAKENTDANAANVANCELWRISIKEGYKTGTAYESNFMKVLGRNPDGSRNPNYPIYLNITNLIGYCFSSHLGADTDSPCNNTPTVNNINALRYVIDGEADEDGWIWNRHDAEWTLGFANSANSSYTYDNTELGRNNAYFNPHGLHWALAENAEYRMIFADQVYRHFVRKGGSMTVEKCTERFKARMDEIDSAIVCESARWHATATHEDWLNSCSKRLEFITNRVPYLVNNIYRGGWHPWCPSIDAPTAVDAAGETVMDGTEFAAGAKITFANADQGTVYYTLDGGDPRLYGGERNPKALMYTAPIEPPSGSTRIRARTLSAGGEWSALEEVTVLGSSSADADPRDALRVAEIMSSSACADGDADDYLVLTNRADSAVSLAGVKLVAWNAKKKTEDDPSLTLVFEAGTEIPAHGARTLTMADFAGGKLTNSKVGLRLYDVSGAAPVLFQDCLVDADWFGKACDGAGGSFIALEFGAEVKTATQWRASTQEPPPDGDDIPSEDGGYRFVLEGDYTGVRSLTPTGAECRVILKGANIPDGLVLNGGAVFEFKPDSGTTNDVGSLYGPAATFKVEGNGAVRLAGSDTLATVSNLHVKAGSLLVRSTGVAATKTPVVNVLGYAKQSGGTIDIDLSVATTNQIYGIFLANKDLKDAEGNNLGVVYAEISGGTFQAKVGATKSSALYVDKGSVDTTFKGSDTVVAAELAGTAPRLVSTAGDLEIKNGSFTVTMPESYSTVADARVFKTDKDIEITGGVFDVNVPGPGAEIFCADEAGGTIKVEDGTFELVADDDCFSAMDRITVDGGTIYAVSLSNDVFDSNGDMRLRGGTILAYATAKGHEAFDVDPEATAEGTNPHVLTVSNAVVFATGGKTADWPDNFVLGEGTKAVVLEDAAASAYAGKYLTLFAPATKLSYAAKLPAFPSTECAIFATVPGYDGATPSTSATAPAKGDRGFHDLYVWNTEATNQENLRFHTIYGSTNEGSDDDGTFGDVGEYIVLTNVSDQVVSLAGLTLSTAKIDKNGKVSDPSCSVASTGGTVPAYGSVRLDQADFAGKGWTKISNGHIAVRLEDTNGTSIQAGEADFDLYAETDGGGAALVAKRFDLKTPLTATTNDWEASFRAVEIETPAFVTDGTALRFDGEPGTTGTKFSMTIANPVEGAYYTGFVSETLEGTFTAEANSTRFSGGSETYTLAIEADKPTKFARVVVSTAPFEKGDNLPPPSK